MEDKPERDTTVDEWVEEKLYPLPVIRNDCAFCGWERTRKDDNHAPKCFYWDVFS